MYTKRMLLVTCKLGHSLCRVGGCQRRREIALGKAACRLGAWLGCLIELCMNSICFGTGSVTFGKCLDTSERRFLPL